MDLSKSSKFPVKENIKKGNAEQNNTEYFEFHTEIKTKNIQQKTQSSRLKIYNRKLNQVKYTSVNFVIIKVNMKIISLYMRSQYICCCSL